MRFDTKVLFSYMQVLSTMASMQKKSHGSKLTSVKHSESTFYKLIILQPVLAIFCDQHEISEFDQKMSVDPPPTESLYNEFLLVLFLGKCFNVAVDIGKTRLGEVLIKLKERERELLITLVCRLAFVKTCGHNPEIVELSNALLQQGHETITTRNTLGLIDFRTFHDEQFSSGNSFSFIDLTLQKLLTAMYLCHQPIMTVIDFIKQFIFGESSKDSVIVKDCGEVLQFVFGLAESKHGIGECTSDVLPHLLHYTCQFIPSTEPIVDNNIALLVLACLRQAQSPSLCKKVHHEFFKRQILSYKIDMLELHDIKYYLASTTEQHQNWTLYCNDESDKPNLVEFVSSIKREFSVTVHVRCYPALTRYETRRVTISNRNPDHLLNVMGQVLGKDQSTTILQEGATSSSSSQVPSVYGYLTVEQMESMKAYENITYYNMVKDLLMTPLQLYSTLPMQTQYRKGDHIWLMGSQNIRYNFYKNVEISPLPAMHWVKVSY